MIIYIVWIRPVTCIISTFADIELPNEQGRMDILKIHALKITKHGEIGRFEMQPLSL